MTKELQALEANNTWELTTLPANKTPIGSKWVFKIKYHADGALERYKGRLVAKGFNQKEGLDINNAFLHGDINEEVYMTVPQGYNTTLPPNTVCRLKKSLYGLKQANRKCFTSLLVYVDDILLAGNNQSLITDIKQQLHKTFSIKDLGSLHYYLGIEILKNSTGLTMSQRKYALELPQSGNVLNDKPAITQLDPQNRLINTEGELLSDPSYYKTLVGKLIYLTIIRPDISFAAQLLSQFSYSPKTTHMKALTRVLRYIKLSPGQGLHFSPTTNPQLQAYYDSDWAACPVTIRSITGLTVFLGKCLISWTAKKQSVVLRSSIEAEYRALADCTYEITWLNSLLKDLNIHLSNPTTIYYDNASTIALASNPIQHARTKHIELDCHFIRDKIKEGSILPTFIPSRLQAADILIKGLRKTRNDLAYRRMRTVTFEANSFKFACVELIYIGHICFLDYVAHIQMERLSKLAKEGE
ncbi:retrovirus-related pol polyprotein from transposon RE1 [Tanacetum coccineum]